MLSPHTHRSTTPGETSVPATASGVSAQPLSRQPDLHGSQASNPSVGLFGSDILGHRRHSLPGDYFFICKTENNNATCFMQDCGLTAGVFIRQLDMEERVNSGQPVVLRPSLQIIITKKTNPPSPTNIGKGPVCHSWVRPTVSCFICVNGMYPGSACFLPHLKVRA